MNIFILDWQHKTCAEYHCDKHVVKMPLETTQMLSTVHWRYNNDGPYLPVHQKHPCTLWAGQTVENYIWLWKLGIALCEEFTHRYDKVHSCERILAILRLPPGVHKTYAVEVSGGHTINEICIGESMDELRGI